MPEVSVVIPLYNKSAYVERTLRSVLAQSFRDLEVIVVDDGSTDDGADIVKGVNDPRIRLVRQRNQGVSAARNRGIEEAGAELIAFLDADDEWTPEFLEVIMRLRKRYPEAGVYAAAYKIRLRNGRDKLMQFNGLPEGQTEGLLRSYFSAAARGRLPVRSSNLAIPKKVFSDVGTFSVGDWWGEDNDMWGRIALRYPVAFSREICMIYHIDAANGVARTIRSVKEHPFVESARKAMGRGKAPPELIEDLAEYVDVELINTAKRNLLGGANKLARENLRSCISGHFTLRKRLLMLETYLPQVIHIMIFRVSIWVYSVI